MCYSFDVIDFDVSVIDDELLVRNLQDLTKQARYAMMLAINDAVFSARKRVFKPAIEKAFEFKTGSARRFFLKGLKPGADGPGGIGVKKATKEKLEASVFFGTGLEFIRLHESGKTKLPPRGTSGIIIRNEDVDQPKKVPKRMAVLRRLVSSNTGRGKRVFEAGKGTRHHRIVERLPGRETGKRYTKRGKVKRRKARGLRVLAWIEQKARIRKVIDVEASAQKHIDQELRKRFTVRFKQALKTAR